MANCPKCGKKLAVTDWRPNCPECGINLVYYGFEDRFYNDAKVAELSMANVRVKFKTVIAGLIGGKLPVARLVCSLLPLLSLLIPVCSAKFDIGIYQKTISFSAIGAYQSFTDGSLSLLRTLSSAESFGASASSLTAVMYALIATAVVSVLIVLMSILCFLSYKKMAAVICSLSVLQIVACAVTEVLSFKVFSGGDVLSVSKGYGCIVAIAAGITVFILNYIISRKGISVEHKPGDLERVAIRTKLKKGELKISELPFPIIETEEEKAERLKENQKEGVKVSE